MTEGPPDAGRQTYSVSALMVYEACPQQYYSAFVRRIPPPVTPGMRRGTSIHKLIADQLAQPSLFPPDVPPDLEPLFLNFHHSRFNRRPLAVEQGFTLSFAGGDVRGRIDVIFPRGHDGLEVVDFKSGTPPDPTGRRESLQLPVYAIAAGGLFDVPTEEVVYTYSYLRDGAERSGRLTEDDAEALADRINGIIADIQSGNFRRRSGCRCYACTRLSRHRRDTRASV